MTMHHIATLSGTGTYYFNSIPQNYTHLQLRVSGRSGQSAINGNFYSNVNAGGYTYNDHTLYGTGSAGASANHSGLLYIFAGAAFPAATALANNFGSIIVDIFDYTNTNKNKVYKICGGYNNNGSGVVQLASGLIQTTGAVTNTYVDTESGFVAGSTASLYGIISNPIA